MNKQEKQAQLDKQRWIRSEKAKHDMGGTFEHCKFCKHKSEGVSTPYYNAVPHCNTTYEQRQKECPCATAYWNWTHRNSKK